MVDTLQMTRSLGSYADVLADAGIVREDVRDEAREIEIAYATDDSRCVVPRTLFVCKGAAFKRSTCCKRSPPVRLPMCPRSITRSTTRWGMRSRACW